MTTNRVYRPNGQGQWVDRSGDRALLLSTAKWAGLATFVFLAPVCVPQFNALMDWSTKAMETTVGVTQQVTSAVVDRLAPAGELDLSETLKDGDFVAGYPVTSPFGPRIDPLTGEPGSPHNGIDLGTPVGTSVYAIGSKGEQITVECETQDLGGLVAWLTTDMLPGMEIALLHLDKCAEGNWTVGSVIARTGNSGARTTGPHLDIRIKQDGEWIDPPKEIVVWLMTGKPAERPVSVQDTEQDQTLTDEELACAIGQAEGTRDLSCGFTEAYYGHEDPGNSKHNMGSFSYQHGAESPEEADREWLKYLREQEVVIREQAQAAGVILDKASMIQVLDSVTQAPAVTLSDSSGLVAQLKAVLSEGMQGQDAMIEARVRAWEGHSTTLSDIRANQADRVIKVAGKAGEPSPALAPTVGAAPNQSAQTSGQDQAQATPAPTPAPTPATVAPVADYSILAPWVLRGEFQSGHPGYDLVLPGETPGQPVYSPIKGTVTCSQNVLTGGVATIVAADKSITWMLEHLDPTTCKAGDVVSGGQVGTIANDADMGAQSKMPHLHAGKATGSTPGSLVFITATPEELAKLVKR